MLGVQFRCCGGSQILLRVFFICRFLTSYVRLSFCWKNQDLLNSTLVFRTFLTCRNTCCHACNTCCVCDVVCSCMKTFKCVGSAAALRLSVSAGQRAWLQLCYNGFKWKIFQLTNHINLLGDENRTGAKQSVDHHC